MKISYVDKNCHNTPSSSEEEEDHHKKVVSTVPKIFNESDNDVPTINKLKE